MRDLRPDMVCTPGLKRWISAGLVTRAGPIETVMTARILKKN